jgi:hypothetical protein
MIIELSFVLVGGTNLALEKNWETVQNIMNKYPQATWRKIVYWKKGIGKYIIKI